MPKKHLVKRKKEAVEVVRSALARSLGGTSSAEEIFCLFSFEYVVVVLFFYFVLVLVFFVEKESILRRK